MGSAEMISSEGSVALVVIVGGAVFYLSNTVMIAHVRPLTVAFASAAFAVVITGVAGEAMGSHGGWLLGGLLLGPAFGVDGYVNSHRRRHERMNKAMSVSPRPADGDELGFSPATAKGREQVTVLGRIIQFETNSQSLFADSIISEDLDAEVNAEQWDRIRLRHAQQPSSTRVTPEGRERYWSMLRSS